MTETQLIKYLNDYNKIFLRGRLELIKILVKRLKDGYITANYFNETMLDVIKELNALSRQSSVFIQSFISENYIDGIIDNELILNKYKMLKLKSNVENPLHKNSVEVLINTMNDNINKSLEVIGKNIRNIVDDIVINNAAEGLSLKSVEIARNLIIDDLKNNKIFSIIYKNGTRMSIESYADMAARSVIREATNTAMVNVLTTNNIDLVRCTEHYPTCHICAIYQGRVYSINPSRKDYPYLYDTVFAHGYKNIHPNCKHVLVPYIENLYDKKRIATDKKYSNSDFTYDEKNKELIKENEKYKEMMKEKRRLSIKNKEKQLTKEEKEL